MIENNIGIRYDIGIINLLDDIIKRYDKVFLIRDSVNSSLIEDFLSYAQTHHHNKSILLLSSKSDSCEYYGITVMRISVEIETEIQKLYKMYDFSDGFSIVEENSLFGSLFNYVRTGTITMNDVFKALLR